MRRDLSLVSDSPVVALMSKTSLDRRERGEVSDEQLAAQKLVFERGLRGEGANVRLVVDEALSDEEQLWSGRASGVLVLDEDGLVLTGGLVEDTPLAPTASEVFAVAAGRYRVDIHSYLSAKLDGPYWPLCSRFRREYPGEPIPQWLATWCLDDADMVDPEGADDWEDLEAAIAAGRLSIDADPRQLIDFVIQLERSDEDANEHAWGEQDRQEPSRFPKGLRSDELPERPDMHPELRSYLA